VKILSVIDSLRKGGGIQQSLIDILPKLQEKGIRSHVLTLYDQGDLYSEFEKYNIPVFTLNLSSRWDFLKSLRNFRQILKKYDYDIIHAHHPISQLHVGLSRLISSNEKRLSTYHDQRYNVYPAVTLKTKLLKKVQQTVNHRCFDAHTAVSSGVKEYVSTELHIKDITVIPNGTDIEKIQSMVKLSQSSTISFGNETSKYSMLAVTSGRFVKEKGHRILVEAIAANHKKLEHIRFLLIGDGEEKDSIRDLIRKYKLTNIEIIPSLEHKILMGIIKNADLVVVPSLSEGFPLVIGEAMALGKPIVASDISGINECLQTEKNALLVPPADPIKLSMAIDRLASDPILRQKLSVKASIDIKKFEIGLIAEKWIGFYAMLRYGLR